MLRFEPLTLVPIQREFIDVSLLSNEELKWLNDYHRKCEEIIGNELKKLNKLNVYNWLVEQCKPVLIDN
jgi:Xaa-Pro aminopeptidase